jgi:hypothetical protein
MSEDDRQDERAERRKARHAAVRRARVDWFGRELGDEWETDGDGVYRYVGAPEPRRPDPSQALDEALRNAAEVLRDTKTEPDTETEEQPSESDPQPGPRWWQRS